MNSDGSNPAKKFYFLDYFYIILSVFSGQYEENSLEAIKQRFMQLKDKMKLGESKYKKLTIDEGMSLALTKTQIDRITYTFKQVLGEAIEYGLIDYNDDFLTLTQEGQTLLSLRDSKGEEEFNDALLQKMETSYSAFYYLVNFLYAANPNDGCLFFPHYSPRLLDMPKSSLKTTRDVRSYIFKLMKKIEQDVWEFSKQRIHLCADKLHEELYKSQLLLPDDNAPFNSSNYNSVIRRCKDYFEIYLLKNIYKYNFSWSAFEIWSYRAKQLGIVHVTEFYPSFSGKLIFPLSIRTSEKKGKDFKQICTYDDSVLYIHSPEVEPGNIEVFSKYLVDAYFKIKRTAKTYFINLLAIREIVCYNMKISEKTFESFLNHMYRLNLQSKLQIKIALEVDKLPEETKAMYLTREPVMIAGKYRNIIAIDISKEHYK